MAHKFPKQDETLNKEDIMKSAKKIIAEQDKGVIVTKKKKDESKVSD